MFSLRRAALFTELHRSSDSAAKIQLTSAKLCSASDSPAGGGGGRSGGRRGKAPTDTRVRSLHSMFLWSRSQSAECLLSSRDHLLITCWGSCLNKNSRGAALLFFNTRPPPPLYALSTFLTHIFIRVRGNYRAAVTCRERHSDMCT